MKYCVYCGKELEENAVFCIHCGKQQPAAEEVQEAVVQEQSLEVTEETPAATVAPDAALEEEKNCLDLFYRFFKYERLCWKIFGIVFLVLSILMGVLALFMIALGAGGDGEMLGLGAMYVLYTVLYLPFAIISLSMVKKAERYMNELYTDARPMVTRCNSVGMIVFSAIFNNIAMIFIVINFARAKGEKALLERIIARQQGTL